MIKSIKLSKFKCFYQSTVNLKPLTIMSGINAVGKSSVIQSLLLLLQCERAYDSQNRLGTITQKITLNDNKGLYLGNVQDIINYFTDERNFTIEYVNETNKVTLNSQINNNTDTVSFNALVIREGEHIDNFHIDLLKSQYISAERIGPRTIHDDGGTLDNVGYLGQNATSILNINFNQEVPLDRCLSEKSLSLLLKSVEEWINYIVPGTELRTEYLSEVEKVKLQIKNSKEGKFIKPSNTGFGISYVLPIIVAGMIAAKDSLLIIENPEAHLHPLGQSRIGEFLVKIANSGVQVIVETHSDHVINGVRLSVAKKQIEAENTLINFFTRVTDVDIKIDSIEINELGEIAQWPQGFLDQEKNDLKELFMVRLKK